MLFLSCRNSLSMFLSVLSFFSPAFPPFNLGWQNQTDRKHEDAFFLHLECKPQQQIVLLQVCQIKLGFYNTGFQALLHYSFKHVHTCTEFPGLKSRKVYFLKFCNWSWLLLLLRNTEKLHHFNVSENQDLEVGKRSRSVAFRSHQQPPK